MKTRFKVSNANIQLSSAAPTLTAGMVNAVECEFIFDSNWNGLEKVAVFKAGDVTISVLQNNWHAENSVFIPWEVLEKPHEFLHVGIFGSRDNEIKIPTVWCQVNYIQPGADESAAEGKPATETLWNTIINSIGKLENLSTEAKSNLVAAINEIFNHGGGSGTTDHNSLDNRDAKDQHPISAITGLVDTLKNLLPLKAGKLNSLTDDLYMAVGSSKRIKRLGTPIAEDDAANKKYVDGSISNAIYKEVNAYDYKIAIQAKDTSGYVGWHASNPTTENKIAICNEDDESQYPEHIGDDLLKIEKNDDYWVISSKKEPTRIFQVNNTNRLSFAAFYVSNQVKNFRLFNDAGTEIATLNDLHTSIYEGSLFIIAEQSNSHWALLEPSVTSNRIACTDVTNTFLESSITSAQDIVDAIIESGSSQEYLFIFSEVESGSSLVEKYAKTEDVAVKSVPNGGGILGDNTATGLNSLAIGSATSAIKEGSLAIGRYNETASNKVFMVGGGGKSSSKTVMSIDGAGNVTTDGKVTAAGDIIVDGLSTRDAINKIDDIWYGYKTEMIAEFGNGNPVIFTNGNCEIYCPNVPAKAGAVLTFKFAYNGNSYEDSIVISEFVIDDHYIDDRFEGALSGYVYYAWINNKFKFTEVKSSETGELLNGTYYGNIKVYYYVPINIEDPTSDLDAANKRYVDTVVKEYVDTVLGDVPAALTALDNTFDDIDDLIGGSIE